MNRTGSLFLVSLLAIAAGALAIRLPRLDQRPMHPDEANQALRASLLLEDSVYRYDPEDHHGPTLYYATLPVFWAGGVREFSQTSEWHYRLVPVLFGAGLILLLPLLADGLGRGAMLAAALLTAVSPGMVYFSRYYIQEILLVCFTCAALGCLWRYFRSGSAWWAIAAGAAIGLMHATKETWVLAAAAMAAGGALTALWNRGVPVVRGCGTASGAPDPAPGRPAAGDCAQAGGPAPSAKPAPSLWRGGLWAAAAAVLVAVVLCSSLGTNLRGPLDSILAYGVYLRRGVAPELHSHPWYYYLDLLLFHLPPKSPFRAELLIVALAAVGGGFALFARAHRGGESPSLGAPPRPPIVPSLALARFLTFYTLALIALYSAVSYKTPWCLLSFLHGLILLAGLGAAVLVRGVPTLPAKIAVAGLLAAGLWPLHGESQWFNGRLAADARNPYVYAHSSTDVKNLAAQAERLAAVSPAGHELIIHVVTPENYWPLPWYLRRFNRDHIGYWQDAEAWWRDTRTLPPPAVVILTSDVQESVDERLSGPYNRQMIYGLRPGVLLSVYVQQDLWDAMLASQAARSSP